MKKIVKLLLIQVLVLSLAQTVSAFSGAGSGLSGPQSLLR